jgi:glucans biosynthesis protein C
VSVQDIIGPRLDREDSLAARDTVRAVCIPWQTDALLSERVQAVRGLIIVLLVAFHAIGITADTVVNRASAAGLITFSNCLAYVRMPVFGFVAGFVYAMRPATPATRRSFILRKVSRLFVPGVIATTLMLLLNLIGNTHVAVSTQLHEAWRSYVYPSFQFWFIQALLVDFAVVLILEAVGALSSIGRFALTLVVAIAADAWLPAPGTSFFSVPEAEYLLPFFLLGLGAYRFRTEILSNRVLVASVLLLLGGIAVQTVSVLDPGYRAEKDSLLAFAVGLSAGLCAIRWVPRFEALRQLGGYSFAIYLYHYAFIDICAHVCKLAGFRSAVPLTLVLVGVGILGPVILQHTVRPNPHLRSAVLGMR